VLYINPLLTAPVCRVFTQPGRYDRASKQRVNTDAPNMAGACFIHWPVWPVRGLYGPTLFDIELAHALEGIVVAYTIGRSWGEVLGRHQVRKVAGQLEDTPSR